MNKLFLELILISVGKRIAFSRIPTDAEWGELYNDAEKQSLIGLCFSGLECLLKEQLPNMDWLGQADYIKNQNELVSNRAADVTRLFAKDNINL